MKGYCLQISILKVQFQYLTIVSLLTLLQLGGLTYLFILNMTVQIQLLYHPHQTHSILKSYQIFQSIMYNHSINKFTNKIIDVNIINISTDRQNRYMAKDSRKLSTTNIQPPLQLRYNPYLQPANSTNFIYPNTHQDFTPKKHNLPLPFLSPPPGKLVSPSNKSNEAGNKNHHHHHLYNFGEVNKENSQHNALTKNNRTTVEESEKIENHRSPKTPPTLVVHKISPPKISQARVALKNIIKENQEIPKKIDQNQKHQNNQKSEQLNKSSSFKNMLQSKTKTTKGKYETIFGFNNKSHHNSNGLKQSPCLISSKNPSFLHQADKFCSNNDGKKAKYRVKPNYNQQQNQLIYCSKCAMALVQNGYTLEDLPTTISLPKEDRTSANHIRLLLKNKRQSIMETKQQGLLEYKNIIQRIDNYYNSLIISIDEERTKNKEYILKKQQKWQQIPQEYLVQLSESISSIDNYLNSNENGLTNYFSNIFQSGRKTTPSIAPQFKHYHNILQKTIDLSIPEIFIKDSQLQKQFKRFQSLLQNQIRINLTDKNDQKQSALKFSFQEASYRQKLVYEKDKEKNKVNKLFQSNMNTLSQQSEQGDDTLELQVGNKIKIDEKQVEVGSAFRCLFEQCKKQIETVAVPSPSFKQF